MTSTNWRYCHPSYYLKRPKRLALLFIGFVCVSFVVWDRQTLVREHQVLAFGFRSCSFSMIFGNTCVRILFVLLVFYDGRLEFVHSKKSAWDCAFRWIVLWGGKFILVELNAWGVWRKLDSWMRYTFCSFFISFL